MSEPDAPYTRLTVNLNHTNAGALQDLKEEGYLLTDITNDAIELYLSLRRRFGEGDRDIVVSELRHLRKRRSKA